MVIWIILFFIILIISFFLALKSMEGYHENPSGREEEYGLFRIQNPANLTSELMNKLYYMLVEDGSIISFERLFKGQNHALVVYGPKSVLLEFNSSLDLLELEDYTQRIDRFLTDGNKTISSWEVGLKHKKNLKLESGVEPISPELAESEEFWWQVTLQPLKEDTFSKIGQNVENVLQGKVGLFLGLSHPDDDDQSLFFNHENKFRAAIRAVLIAGSQENFNQLKQDLNKVGSNEGLLPLPQLQTSREVIDLYKKRSFPLGRYETLSFKSSQLVVPASRIPNLVVL